MSFSFGRTSEKNLETCNEKLQRICRRVLDYGVLDFSVIEGHRTTERQQMLFHSGKSQIDGINQLSNHQYQPSRAVDLLPYPGWLNGVNVWEDRQRFSVLAGLVLAASREEEVSIRWGGDWDGDGNNADSSFDDLPHFELLE